MIPSEMAAMNQWVVWRYEQVKDKPTKVPYSPLGGKAKSNDPSTWTTLAIASAYVAQNPTFGLGFELGDGSLGLAGIDLDKTEDPATPADVKAFHYKIISHFADTYTEQTPSKTGYRILLGATLPPGHRNKWGAMQLEFYTRDRFFTVTGIGNDMPILNKQSDIEAFIHEFPEKKESVTTAPDQLEVNTDGEILTKCAQAANGDKFQKLWEGDFIELYPSHSEADMALCNILAFYTDNRKQVARLWLKSPLGQSQPKRTRNKWVMDMVDKSFDQKPPIIDPVVAAALTAQIKEQLATQKLDATTAYQDWTLPPGMVGLIAKFIFDAAPSPIKEVALAGAIAFYAGLMGRSYNVSGMGLNQYIVVLAPTGAGKEAAKAGISKICNLVDAMLGDGIDIDWFIGPEMIASSQGLLNRIADNPCCVSILPEFGKLLNELCDIRANQNSKNILAAFLKLYSSSGKSGRVGASAYSDRTKNAKAIESPAFSILGESNQTTFYRAVNELSVSDGFLPRLTLIEYNGKTPKRNKKAHYIQPDPSMLLLLQAQIRQNQSTLSMREVIEVAFAPDAEAYGDKLSLSCIQHIDEHNAANETHFAEIWTRVYAKVIKLAALIAVGVDSTKPLITLADITWADQLVTRGVEMLAARFVAGDVGASNYQFEQTVIMEKQLKSYINATWTPQFEKNYYVSEEQKAQGIVYFQYINANLRTRPAFKNSPDLKRAFENTISMLVDAGKLIEIKSNEIIVRNGRVGKMWRIISL